MNNSTDARPLKRSHFHSDAEFVNAVEEQYGYNDYDPHSVHWPKRTYLNVPRRIRLQYTKAKHRATVRVVNAFREQLGVS